MRTSRHDAANSRFSQFCECALKVLCLTTHTCVSHSGGTNKPESVVFRFLKRSVGKRLSRDRIFEERDGISFHLLNTCICKRE